MRSTPSTGGPSTPWLTFDYGARYARYGYLAEDRGFLSPRVGFTLEPYKGTRCLDARRPADGRARSRGVPAASDHRSGAAAGAHVRARISGQDMRAERARLVDLQLEHEFDGAYVFGVRRFYQNVDDQLVTLFRVSPAGSPKSLGPLLRRERRRVRRVRLGVSHEQPAVGALEASVDYAVAQARWTSTQRRIWAPRRPRSFAPTPRDIHDITTSVFTDIPETATRFYLLYRISSAFTRSDASIRPGIDSRFDVQVNQALPFGVAGTKWEVLVGLRNLFRDVGEPGLDLRRTARRPAAEASRRRLPRSVLRPLLAVPSRQSP